MPSKEYPPLCGITTQKAAGGERERAGLWPTVTGLARGPVCVLGKCAPFQFPGGFQVLAVRRSYLQHSP